MNIKIPEYNSDEGFTYNWTDGFEVFTATDGNAMHIKANKEGLLSLANHLLNLAQDEVPDNYHIHLDEYNSLEYNSLELIIEKTETK